MRKEVGLSLLLAACTPAQHPAVDNDLVEDGGFGDAANAGTDCGFSIEKGVRVGFGSFEGLGLLGGKDHSVVDSLLQSFADPEKLDLYYCVFRLRDGVVEGVSATINYSDGLVDDEVAFDDEAAEYVALSRHPRCTNVAYSEEGAFKTVCSESLDLSPEQCGAGLPSLQYNVQQDGTMEFFEGIRTCTGAPNGQMEIWPLGNVEMIYYRMNPNDVNCQVYAEAGVVDRDDNLIPKEIRGDACEQRGAVPTCAQLEGVAEKMINLRAAMEGIYRANDCSKFSE